MNSHSSPPYLRSRPASGMALIAGIALLLSQPAHAAVRTWAGASGDDWNVAADWSSSTKPVAGDTAIFNISLSSVLNGVADQSVGSISFDTAAGTDSGTFTIGSTSGNKLILSHAGTVQILS